MRNFNQHLPEYAPEGFLNAQAGKNPSSHRGIGGQMRNFHRRLI